MKLQHLRFIYIYGKELADESFALGNKTYWTGGGGRRRSTTKDPENIYTKPKIPPIFRAHELS
jgi:hypothetical protein